MRRYLPLILLLAGFVSATTAHAASASLAAARYFSRANGGSSWSTRMHPSAPVDLRIDPSLMRAASIAEQRANDRSKSLCWRYVKQALLAAGAVKSYPKTNYAADAGDELARSYGFTRLSVRDPYAAPVGAVLVYSYGSKGHVEIRTRNGFASDYRSRNACYSRLLAVYGKFSS